MIYECPCGETFSTRSFDRNVEIPWLPWYLLQIDKVEEKQEGLCPKCTLELKTKLEKMGVA